MPTIGLRIKAKEQKRSEGGNGKRKPRSRKRRDHGERVFNELTIIYLFICYLLYYLSAGVRVLCVAELRLCVMHVPCAVDVWICVRDYIILATLRAYNNIINA